MLAVAGHGVDHPLLPAHKLLVDDVARGGGRPCLVLLRAGPIASRELLTIDRHKRLSQYRIHALRLRLAVGQADQHARLPAPRLYDDGEGLRPYKLQGLGPTLWQGLRGRRQPSRAHGLDHKEFISPFRADAIRALGHQNMLQSFGVGEATVGATEDSAERAVVRD